MDLVYPNPLTDAEIKLIIEADGDVTVNTLYLTPKEVLERFGNFITQEELDKIINYGKTTLE